jgi:hypothetical protein
MVKEIQLSNCDKVTLVDDDDYERYQTYKGKRWHYANYYAVISFYPYGNGKTEKVLLHRLINNTPADKWTDHINGDTLDNRKCNLRTVSRSLNILNSKKNKKTPSKLRGVYYRKTDGTYHARMTIDKIRYYLGSFKTPDEAYKSRLLFAVKMGVVIRE